MRFLSAASLLLATLLLPPIAASAQTPLPAKSPLQKVSLQVTFVTVYADDLDALGINFNLIPLPASPRTFIALAEGDIAAQLYQSLTRTATLVGSHTVVLTPIIVSDNAPAVFAVNTQIPVDAMPLPIGQGHSDFPQLTGSIQLRGKITLIPQIVPGNLVTLDMLSPVGNSQRMRLHTISSGQRIMINVAVVKALNSTSQGQITGVSGHSKVSHTTELLVFITPTIVSGATGFTAAPAVKPQTQFLGSTTNFLSGSFGFGTGFGPGRPSDALQSTHWLGSLHWPGRSNIEGTIGRPSIESEAPPLPNGVKRIFAL